MALVLLLAGMPLRMDGADAGDSVDVNLRSGRYMQALSQLASVPTSRRDAGFWSRISFASNRLGHWSTGFRAANLSLRLGFRRSSCYYERGLAAYGLRVFKLARADVSWIIDSNPKDSSPGMETLARCLLALIDAQEGHVQEAQASLLALKAGLAGQSQESTAVAWAMSQLDRLKAAGPQPEPSDPDAWLSRAAVYNEVQDWTDAHQAAQMALALGSKRPVCRLERGLAAYGLGNYAQAESDLGAYLESEPKHTRARTTLALAQAHLGRLDPARASLLAARASTPAAASAFDYALSLVDAQDGKLVRAQDRLRKNLANSGSDDALLRRSEMAMLSRLQSADAAQQGAKIEAIIDAKDCDRAARMSPCPAQ